MLTNLISPGQFDDFVSPLKFSLISNHSSCNTAVFHRHAVEDGVRLFFGMRDNAHVYVRVGPDGSGHTSFILDLATECGMKLFTKRTRTPMKMFNRRSTKFEDTIGRCKEKKMVAFIDTPVKKMCFIQNLKHLEHFFIMYRPCRYVDFPRFRQGDEIVRRG